MKAWKVKSGLCALAIISIAVIFIFRSPKNGGGPESEQTAQINVRTAPSLPVAVKNGESRIDLGSQKELAAVVGKLRPVISKVGNVSPEYIREFGMERGEAEDVAKLLRNLRKNALQALGDSGIGTGQRCIIDGLPVAVPGLDAETRNGLLRNIFAEMPSTISAGARDVLYGATESWLSNSFGSRLYLQAQSRPVGESMQYCLAFYNSLSDDRIVVQEIQLGAGKLKSLFPWIGWPNPTQKAP